MKKILTLPDIIIISIAAVILIGLFLTGIFFVYQSSYNLRIVHSHTIRNCFDRNTVQDIYDCIWYSDLTTEMNVNRKLSIKDVPTFCKDIPEESFAGNILDDKSFSNWIDFTKFDKKDLCYIHLMDFSFYPNYEKYGPDKNGLLNDSIETMYSEKIQVCNSFKDDRKKELCLIYGFEDIDGVCRIYPLPDCVGRCNTIKDESIKNLCLNMNSLCKIYDTSKQYCIPPK